MRAKLHPRLKLARIRHPFANYADDQNGAFEIAAPTGRRLIIIASNGREWKPVGEYETLYEVSNMGEVRALPKSVSLPNGGKRNHEMHELSQEVMKKGYKRVTLQSDGSDLKIMVHVLVANAFIPNPHGFPMVNHIDGNKGHNHVLNLEWCSESYNRHHAIENGLAAGLSAEQIGEIKGLLDNGMTLVEVAAEFNRSRQTICDIKLGRHRNLYPDQPSGYQGLDVFWDHVSVSVRGTDDTPAWDEMCFVKDLFFEPEEPAFQYHPPHSRYINIHQGCLHLWRPQNEKIPLPPLVMV